MRARLINEDIINTSNLSEDFDYFTDMEDSLEEDDIAGPCFYQALEEFGLDKEFVGVICAYGADDYEGAKKILENKDVDYLEFDGGYGDMCLLFNVNDLENNQ